MKKVTSVLVSALLPIYSMTLRKSHLLWILVSHLCNDKIDSKVFCACKSHWFYKRIKDREQNREHFSSLKLKRKA